MIRATQAQSRTPTDRDCAQGPSSGESRAGEYRHRHRELHPPADQTVPARIGFFVGKGRRRGVDAGIGHGGGGRPGRAEGAGGVHRPGALTRRGSRHHGCARAASDTGPDPHRGSAVVTPAAGTRTRWPWTPWRCWSRPGADSPVLVARFPASDLKNIAPGTFVPPRHSGDARIASRGRVGGVRPWDFRHRGLRIDRRRTSDADPARDIRGVRRAGLAAHRRLSSAGEDPRTAAAAALVETLHVSVEKLSHLLNHERRRHLVLTPERVVAS